MEVQVDHRAEVVARNALRPASARAAAPPFSLTTAPGKRDPDCSFLADRPGDRARAPRDFLFPRTPASKDPELPVSGLGKPRPATQRSRAQRIGLATRYFPPTYAGQVPLILKGQRQDRCAANPDGRLLDHQRPSVEGPAVRLGCRRGRLHDVPGASPRPGGTTLPPAQGRPAEDCERYGHAAWSSWGIPARARRHRQEGAGQYSVLRDRLSYASPHGRWEMGGRHRQAQLPESSNPREGQGPSPPPTTRWRSHPRKAVRPESWSPPGRSLVVPLRRVEDGTTRPVLMHTRDDHGGGWLRA